MISEVDIEAFKEYSLPFAACACIGQVGNDLHCPCTMSRLGLKGDCTWTDEDKARLNKALSELFEWNEDEAPAHR